MSKIFVAGATGVIGSRVVPLLVAAGHTVAGTTRSAERADSIRALGAEAVVVDVFDAAALRAAVVAFAPDVVMHQLTDLPDDARDIPNHPGANARMRRKGSRNLIDAATAAGASLVIAQSVAWTLQGDGAAAVEDLERMVLDVNGVVVRYGQFHGPGTYHVHTIPDAPYIHIDEAARRTLPALDLRAIVLTISE